MVMLQNYLLQLMEMVNSVVLTTLVVLVMNMISLITQNFILVTLMQVPFTQPLVISPEFSTQVFA